MTAASPTDWNAAHIREMVAVIREQHDALIAVRHVLALVTEVAHTDAQAGYVRLLEQVDGAIASGQEWL